jgi:hypothetical protein
VDSIKSVSFYLLDKKRVAFDILGTSNFYTNSVKYFPNPTSDRLTVQLEQNLDRASLEIIGMNGQILQRQLIENGVTQLETDVSALPTGLYFLQVREQERLIFTGKFVKIE